MEKLEQFIAALEAFLNHKEKKVLAIKGPWGVGKTYFWNNYIKSSHKSKDMYYAYVSLFGVSTLGEIQSAIFYNSEKIGDKVAADTIKENLKKITQYSKKIPQIGKFSDALTILEKSLLNDILICIDDIERKNKDLSISSILGLISELSIENECKFILIFNYDTLENKDKEDFNKYREKVVDLELEYCPTTEQNHEIVFKDHPYKKVIYNTLYPLNLKNIRILKHIRWNIENFLDILTSFEKEVANEIISSTTVLTYIHHDPSIKVDIEGLEFLFSYHSDENDEQKLQKETIRALGYTHFANYEKELVKYIADGVYDKKDFLNELTKLNDRQKKSNFQKEISQVWGLFNNNFRATAEEVVAGFSSFLDKHVEEMSYREIEPMVAIIRKLDRSVKTSKWIDRFINKNLDNFSRKDIQFFRGLTSTKKVLETLDDFDQKIYSTNSIKSTLNRIIENRGWNPEDEEFLNSHSEEELYAWLKNEDTDRFLSIVREALKFFPPQKGETAKAQFGTKLHNAVTSLAKRSSVNEIRLKDFFGININVA